MTRTNPAFRPLPASGSRGEDGAPVKPGEHVPGEKDALEIELEARRKRRHRIGGSADDPDANQVAATVDEIGDGALAEAAKATDQG